MSREPSQQDGPSPGNRFHRTLNRIAAVAILVIAMIALFRLTVEFGQWLGL